MNTTRYLLKKAKLMNADKQKNSKKTSVLKTTTKHNNDTMKETYALLSQLYSQENDPLFI
jgi:hypothetical protein